MIKLEDVSEGEEHNATVLEPAGDIVRILESVSSDAWDGNCTKCVNCDHKMYKAITMSSTLQDSDNERLDLANFSELKQAQRELSRK